MTSYDTQNPGSGGAPPAVPVPGPDTYAAAPRRTAAVSPAAGPDADGKDSGGKDSGSADAGPADAGPADAGRTDSGSADGGRVDAGSVDDGSGDAGSGDAGRERSGAVPGRGGAGRSGAQSVDRTLQLLDAIGAADGPCTLSDLAAATGLAAPTAHRLIASLVRFGYVRQEPSRRYTLGPRLVVLGERATRLLGGWAQPWLARLRDLTGETTNLAILDGDEMVYLTQAAGRHQMRMFTEPGRRVLPHATAVGKVLLARLPEAAVRALLARTGMPAYTPATLTDPDQLLAQLDLVRRRGYAVDDEEQEAGVRCFAVALPATADRMAMSVSGPLGRISDAAITRFTPQLRRLADELGAALG